MKKYGMVKTYYVFDEEGKVEDKIDFTYNFRTPILYMNYTGRDIMADFNKIAVANTKALPALRPEVVEKLERVQSTRQLDLSDFTEEELTALVQGINTTEYNSFMHDFVKVLYATTIYPQQLDWNELDNYIPIGVLQDPDFLKGLTDLMVFGMPDYKKKLV